MKSRTDKGAVPRAAQKIDWGMRALVAATTELQAVGARGASEVGEDEADRLGHLAAEVRALVHAPANP